MAVHVHRTIVKIEPQMMSNEPRPCGPCAQPETSAVLLSKVALLTSELGNNETWLRYAPHYYQRVGPHNENTGLKIENPWRVYPT